MQLSVMKKIPKTAPFPLGFRHPAGDGPSYHRHRQHAQKNR